MQEIIVLLLIIILVLMVKFRSYATERFRKLESDIHELKKIQSSKVADTPQAIVKETIQPAPKKPEKDYWESSFKRMDEPVIMPQEKENIAGEIKQPELQAEEKMAPVLNRKNIIPPPPVVTKKPTFFERNPDLEKFIGENLVSKIGIAILVLAIGFFVKFAIDNNWIGPVGRVGVGILCGGILVGLAHRLRNNYKAFSSVLAGGGLAVFYFTITLAYHQFNLFSQTTAFIIMVVITAFAVVLSLLYNRQELAIIALIGGFAAPFLVSDGSGNYKALFTYLLVLNTGLLVIAYNKAWRLMNVLAFIFTVILFGGWLLSLKQDVTTTTYSNGLLFATAFYLMFFFVNIANNIKENKKFIASDFSILLVNTALYFAAGLYCIVKMNESEYKGLFTICIGVYNLIASYFLFRKRKVDTNILYLFTGITLTFISLTAPIQLHGNYITLFWASETVLLYWLYQKSKISVIYYASIIVWFAMLASLLQDWLNVYYVPVDNVPVILNKGFVTGIYVAVATYLLFILKNKSLTPDNKFVEKFISKNVLRATGLVLLFLAGALEINYQFNYYFPGYDLNVLYLQLYYLLFVLLLLFINNAIATTKLPVNFKMILLVSCIALFIIDAGIISGLQKKLLVSQQFTGYFIACWVNAILLSIVFYKLIQLEKSRNLFVLINYEVAVWLTCAAIIIFLSLETFWMVNSIFTKTRILSGKFKGYSLRHAFLFYGGCVHFVLCGWA